MKFEQWVREAAHQGESARPTGAPPLGPVSPGVRVGLRLRMKENERYFRITLGLAVVLAVSTIVAAVVERPGAGGWVPAAFGVTTFGAVAFAMQSVRDKLAFEVMLELATGLDEDAMRDVLRVLLKRYGGAVSPAAPGPGRRKSTSRAGGSRRDTASTTSTPGASSAGTSKSGLDREETT